MALSPRDRRLVRVAVAVAQGDWDALAAERAAAPPGEPDRAWREALLQMHLFAGVPRQVEAYAVLAAAGGLGDLDDDEVRSEPAEPARGEELFARIYADQAATVSDALEGYHPDFRAWVLGHAYGRVMNRPGLGADRRELLAVACLTALGQERQLASHLRGALRCGATRDEIAATLDELDGVVDAERIERARRVLERFCP